MVPQPKGSSTTPPSVMEEPNETNVIIGVGVVESLPLQHTSIATTTSCAAPAPGSVPQQAKVEDPPQKPPCVAMTEPVPVPVPVPVRDQPKAVSRMESLISSATSMTHCGDTETVRSSAPQQQQIHQHQHQQQIYQRQQQSLSVATTTEEQKEAQPKPLATAEPTRTSATAAASCTIETHRTTVPQQHNHQQQHQQHHSPPLATTQEDQQKPLAATEPTRSSAPPTTSCATIALDTSAPQQQQQPLAQPSVVTTETETIHNSAASNGNSRASHVIPPTSVTHGNSSSSPQQLAEIVEQDDETPALDATGGAPDGYTTVSCTTESPKSSHSPQQHQNEKEGEQYEPPVTVKTEPIRYPDPVRYLIAGVGSSTPCNVHRPTLEELKAQSFSDFVRHKVLAAASRFVPYSSDDDDDNGDKSDNGDNSDQDKNKRKNKEEMSKKEVATTPVPTPTPTPTPAVAAPERPHFTRRKIAVPERYRVDKLEEKVHVAKKKPTKRKNDDEEEPEEEEWTQGMAKVSLPVGFWAREGIAGDETARGPAWQAGTQLGDMTLEQPIQQNIRGLAGTYEYTFTVQPSMPMRAFRDKADDYRKAQVGSAVEPLPDLTAERLTALERIFWRRLGPTMPPAWYGADQEGTLFGDDAAMGWSIGNLDSLLHILSRVPGVTSPYLYAGMWASVFCAHTEDMNLLSINYLHAGAPKIWYAVAPGPDAARFEALAEFQYSVASKECKEFLRHKRCLMSPRVLQKAGIRYTTTVQMPGEAVITFPGGYHFGFNTGFNVAEATNFGVAEWLPFGRRARVCLCRPDSVRIDLWRLTALLRLYNKDKKKEATLSWKEWGRRKVEENNLRKEKAERKRMKGINAGSPPGKSSPKSKGKGSKKPPKTKPSEQQRKQEFWVEVMRAVTNSRKTAAATTARGKSKRKRNPEKIVEADEEIWHLARPIGRKRLELHTRVLCIVPSTVMSSKRSKAKSKVDIDEEQCFSGEVVEIADDCARVHLDGTQKSEDTWIYSKSAKLFLDGGRWIDQEDEEVSEVPPKHYWKEVDSKRLCVEK